MSVFESARDLIISVEFYLVSEAKSEYRVVNYLQRLIWLPMKFLKIGVAEKIKGATVWAFLAFACIMLATWIVNHFGLVGTELATYLLLFSETVPVFFVVFSMPSMYGASGIQRDSVEFVVNRLQALGFASTSHVEYLRNSVALHESRIKVRVTALKWLVGILWAAFVYAATKSDDQTLSALFTTFPFPIIVACLLLITFTAYLLVWGYEASTNMLFRAIDFGCDEFCSRLGDK